MRAIADCARTVADEIGDNELGVGVDRGPRPDVASAFGAAFGSGDVLLLGVAEGPNFIALDALALTLRTFVMEIDAEPRRLDQQLGYCVDRNVGNPTIERMDDPSQSRARIWTRVSEGQLVHATLYELLCLAKHKLTSGILICWQIFIRQTHILVSEFTIR